MKRVRKVEWVEHVGWEERDQLILIAPFSQYFRAARFLSDCADILPANAKVITAEELNREYQLT